MTDRPTADEIKLWARGTLVGANDRENARRIGMLAREVQRLSKRPEVWTCPDCGERAQPRDVSVERCRDDAVTTHLSCECGCSWSGDLVADPGEDWPTDVDHSERVQREIDADALGYARGRGEA